MKQTDQPTRLAIIGYGKMGKEVERIAHERGMVITARVDIDGPPLDSEGVKTADVAVHFAAPSTVVQHVQELARLGKSIVVGTTGWHQERTTIQQTVERNGIGLVHASNFSIGVNILYRLINEAGLLFDQFSDYDVAIHETHHREKLDAPSGTALSLADILLKSVKRKKEILSGSPNGKIRPEQLQITSTRQGAVVGEHRVTFDSVADSIEIVHRAKNRTGFALGAVVGAEWIKGKKGMFTFDDVLQDLFRHQR